MWRVGQDATLRMTVGALILLDRPPTTNALERTPRPWRRTAYRGCAGAPTIRRRCGPARPGSTIRIPSPSTTSDRSRSLTPGSLRQVLDLVGIARVDPVRPRAIAVGRDADRGARERAGRPVPARPPRAHRRPRRHPAARAAPRRPEWPTRRPRQPTEDGRCGRSRREAVGRTCDRKPGTVTITIDAPRVVRRFARTESTRRVTWILSTRRCAGSSGPSMSPTRCPARLMVTGGPLSSRPASRSLLSHFEVHLRRRGASRVAGARR